jgi:hypothetical protein
VVKSTNQSRRPARSRWHLNNIQHPPFVETFHENDAWHGSPGFGSTRNLGGSSGASSAVAAAKDLLTQLQSEKPPNASMINQARIGTRRPISLDGNRASIFRLIRSKICRDQI